MTAHTAATTEYVMDSASDPGRQQLGHLDRLFNGVTTSFLADIGVWPRMRCLDLGSGSGSIAGWLAEQVGPVGRVVAVDISTEQLEVPSRVEVHRHDIRDGLPVDGEFDLIHARFVLMHLHNREEVLRMLTGTLAPGGWLVLGESPDRPQEVLAAPSAADAELAERVIRTGLRVVREAGVAWEWAYEVEQHFVSAGLRDVRGFEFSPMISGGSAGALLMNSYVSQAEPLLVAAGITETEISRFYALMDDPRFRGWPFMRLVTTAGRKPRR